IKNHLNELATLKQQFSTLSSQSIEKFGKIISTAQVYQTKMDPLNKDIEYLQRQQKNIKDCYEKLNQIKTFRKTSREVEGIVQQGPSQSLSSYLEVMDRLQEAYEFFKQNTLGDGELTRLQSLFALGLKKLSTEFGAVLKQTFYPIEVERLLAIVERSLSENPEMHPSKNLAPLEEASDPLLNTLQFMIHWMKNSQTLSISGGMHGAEGARACLLRYHEFRREVVRSALNKLRILLRERDMQSQSAALRGKANANPQRARPKRPPGFVWDVSLRRQLNETETEDLNSEHLAIAITALVKFMQNERRWLERLQLTSDLDETQVSLDVILKVASNEILTELHNLVRLLQLAEKRAEFHMVLSLLLVMKRICQVGPELLEVLQGIEHILFGFNSSVYKMIHETCIALQKYTEFLRMLPEHTSGTRGVVPPDGTVHELATNALMFFEHLLEFADILSVAMYVDKASSQSNADVIRMMCVSLQNDTQHSSRVGLFLLDAISALVENLERKAESYSDETVQLLFLMNNLQYILKTVNRTEIHRFIQSYKPESVASISSVLDDLRGRYSRTVTVMLRLQPSSDYCASGSLRRRASQFGAALASMLSPTLNHSSLRQTSHLSVVDVSADSERLPIKIPDERRLGNSRNVDAKERAALKSLWHEFNSGFNTLVRQHSSVSIPDRELRDCLERQLIADLIPAYSQFWSRSMNVAFTSHRDKYMRMTPRKILEFPRRIFSWDEYTVSFILTDCRDFFPFVSLWMDIFETYRKSDTPFVCVAAPMVRFSKLPFRLLVREYGVDVACTPMIMADSFVRSAKARETEFTTCPGNIFTCLSHLYYFETFICQCDLLTADRPLIVQVASKDPCELSVATEMLAPYCEGIDLNCGCPQKWAMESGLGSALLRKPELIAALVRAARTIIPRWRSSALKPNCWSTGHSALEECECSNSTPNMARQEGPFSVSAKLRIVPVEVRACGDSSSSRLSVTVELIRRLAAMGVDWITLHARTPSQRSSDPASWDVVREVVMSSVKHAITGDPIPIVLNGDVRTFLDGQRAHEHTGCHGVMAARGLLSEPRLFNCTTDFTSLCELRGLLNRWIYLSARYAGGTFFKSIHQQAYWMLEHHLDRTRRLIFHSVNSFPGLVDWLEDHWTSLGLPDEPMLMHGTF
ncbi:dihydrouridine synthase, partial [Opisthorchis viverrini]